MFFAKDMFKNYLFTLLMALLIWVVCLMPVPETPLNQVSLIDKWTHCVLFGGFSLILWIEYHRLHGIGSTWRSLSCTLLLPIGFGGLVELAQAYCTHGTRSGEWLDFAADAIGVVIVQLICMLPARCGAKAKKDGAGGGNCKNDGHR